MSFFQIDMAGLRTFFCHFQCSHSFGALFSLHKQVVHGDAYYAVFLLVISRIMCTFAPNSRKEMRQTPETTRTKLPNEQIKLHVYG